MNSTNNGQKLTKLSFFIEADHSSSGDDKVGAATNEYLLSCDEIPSLFTDASSVEDAEAKVKKLISDYVDAFPQDAERRGLTKDIRTEIRWKAQPNSYTL